MLAWAIYAYIQKIAIPIKITSIENLVIPANINVLSIFIGAACATCVNYNHIFLSPYLIDISMVKYSSHFLELLYFAVWVIFILVGAKLAEKFGFYKIVLVSLAILFILTFHGLLNNLSSTQYAVHQVLFAIASAIFTAPIFAVLNKLYGHYPNVLHHMLWFTIGYTTCKVFAFLEKKIAIQNGYTSLGWIVFNTTIALCFLAVFKYRALLDTDELKQTSSF